MSTSASEPASTSNTLARTAAGLAIAVIPLNIVLGLRMFVRGDDDTQFLLFLTFTLLALVQLVAGCVAVVSRLRARRKEPVPGLAPVALGVVAAMGAPLGWVLGAFGFAASAMGGAWGRPLRIKGRQVHPELRDGADWTSGARPNVTGLAEPDRRALEALWLHDAQKEHASVPAFSRISWALAAVGAPAELLAWAHRAALEEIDHAQRCFALAAGYGGRSFTVEAMPDLLIGALELGQNPLALLARESVTDGCQLEDFNADVAAACAEVCEEPVTRAVLEQIAREERSHADFSWALLTWLVERHPAAVGSAIEGALEALSRYPRPTAVSAERAVLVSQASPDVLRRHGRLPDATWQALWSARLDTTRARVHALLQRRRAA
jgi:hypothetical protein